MAEYVITLMKQYIKKAYETVAEKNKDIISEMKEMLQKAGTNALNISTDLLEKINEMIKNVKSGEEF